jgi:hypothetical protein
MNDQQTHCCKPKLVAIKQEAAHKPLFKPVCRTAPNTSVVISALLKCIFSSVCLLILW